MLFFSGCKPQHQVIVEHVTKTKFVDSLVIRDSVVTVPVERYVDIVNQLDTLKLETSLAKASTYFDTTNMLLRGEIHNKKGAQFKYIKETETIYKDSIVDKPVPYPVEVIVKSPMNKKLLIWSIISTLGLLGTLWFTFRKKIIKSIK